MRLALLALALLLFAGCGEVPRCWNPGGIPAITVSSPTTVHADGIRRGVPCAPGAVIQAWCDNTAMEIRLPDQGSRVLLVALAYHELGHRIERTHPDIWRYLNALASPTFPCGEDAHRYGLPEDTARAAAERTAAALEGAR